MADEEFDPVEKDDNEDHIVELNKMVVFRFMGGEDVITFVKYFDLDSGEFFCDRPLIISLTTKATKAGYLSIFFRLYMPFTEEMEYSIPSEIIVTQGTPTAAIIKNYEVAKAKFYVNESETTNPDSIDYNSKYDDLTKDILYEDEDDTNDDEEKDED